MGRRSRDTVPLIIKFEILKAVATSTAGDVVLPVKTDTFSYVSLKIKFERLLNKNGLFF
jgi:hypothetical protein